MTRAQTEQGWDLEADVVVVGFGGAGAAAAIEAADQGAEVLAFDRFAGGGATRMSGGVMYSGGGTELQQEAGFDDTADELYAYLRDEVDDAVSRDALRAFCDRSVENFEWVRGFGVPYPFRFEPVKTSYPSSETTLYFSGNETSPPFSEVARPAARGHRAFGRGLTGKVLFEPLRRAALDKGVRLHPYARCRELIRDEDGRVIGAEVTLVRSRVVRALLWLCWLVASNLGALSRLSVTVCSAMIRGLERLSKRVRVRARGGVVIAAGGFIFNREMIRRHIPECLGAMRLGTVADDGAGIGLGTSAGAAVRKMDRSAVWLFFNPPRGFLEGILLDRAGQRICSEELYGATLAMHMVHGHHARSILLIDSRVWKKVRVELKTTREAHFQVLTGFLNLYVNRKKANDLATLERKLDMPPGALERAVAEYHRGVEAGRDDKGKNASYLHRIDAPPYYAIDCDIANRWFLTPAMSLGGLSVDALTAQVLREDGRPVEGLFAAGRSAVGVCSNSYLTGLAIADCIFSGRNAGRGAAGGATEGR